MTLIYWSSEFPRKSRRLSNGGFNYWRMQEGSAAFLDFVIKTYQELVKREELICEGTSTLRIFCMLDVSVMEDAGEFSYFVIGLDRSFGATLDLSSTSTSAIFAVSMADALGAYILGRQN
jgi:hypothetical protein